MRRATFAPTAFVIVMHWTTIGSRESYPLENAVTTKAENRELLRNLVKDIDIAMFTTLSPSGYPVSRPLSTQQVEFDGEVLWFLTRGNSPKVAEIRKQPRVNVAYASDSNNSYVSVTGDARVLRDQAKIDELWSDALKAFFPNGPNDPDLKLIRVRVATAEYWDGPSSALGKAISFIVARVTKNDEFMGENRIIQMRGKGAGTSAAGDTPRSKPMPKAARLPSASSNATRPPAKKSPSASPKKSAVRKTPARKAVARKAPRAVKKAGATRTTSTKKR